MATRMSPFLCVILLTLSGFLCLCAHEGRETTETHHLPHHHIVQVSSLMPSSTCNDSIKGPKSKSSLKVLHKYGPCLQSNLDGAQIPNYTEIFLRDQSRVDSIQLSFSTNSNNSEVRDSQASNLPAYSGQVVGGGNYIVPVGLGTPEQEVRLVFDTGSSLTWTQCEPCPASTCYEQVDKTFDPAKSTSYSQVPCNSPMCSSQDAASQCSTTCTYRIRYGDNSVSSGDFSKERLTLTKSDFLDNFSFGCGHNNMGLFEGFAGLLGLGRSSESIIEQAAQKYGKFFSYCLPSTPSSAGHLTLGNDGGVSQTAKFTPLLKLRSFYAVELTGISVAGRQLSVSPSVFSSPGTIVDSGTVITRLPPEAYSQLRAAVRESLSGYRMTTPPDQLLDTCYDFSGNDKVSVPSISFLFGGGTNVELDQVGVLYPISRSEACLAFADNRNLEGLTIIGNTQQKKLEVVYDVAGEKIGFGPGTCN